MTLKKINGLLSWLLTLTLFGHLGTMSYSMMTGWYNLSVCKALSHSTAGVAALHIAVSLIILCFVNDGAEFDKYKKLNKKTFIQRATGLIIILILHMHVEAFGFIVSGEALSMGNKTWLIATELIFFGAIFAHIMVSFTKSLITFGIIRSEKAEKITDKIVSVICSVLFVITSVSLISFVTSWTGFLG